ncbi:MAG: DNA (cytosine-5-)-methyltransferase [Spirosoma sp.]|nr:DNA (cytosine-5-)-methyltransferase [Spirosoma sp.]
MLNYIDLFAGAGGLSEGFIKAGFNPIAHVEMDKAACLTMKSRVAYHFLRGTGQLDIYNDCLRSGKSPSLLYPLIPAELLDSVIQTEISDDTIPSVFARIDALKKDKKIDLIVGGPPCQTYSLVGRSKINSLTNKHVTTDIRYELYKQYGKFLQRYQPEYFVFENVLGLLSAGNRWLIHQIRHYFETECGYSIKWQILDANKYGVIQQRRRVIIIGKKGLGPFDYPEPETVTRERNWTVKDALFSDLQKLNPGEEKDVSSYTTYIAHEYLTSIGVRDETDFVTQHITRPHNETDLNIYRLAIEKWKERKRLKYNDVPEEWRNHKNVTSFLDRFKVVDPDGLSHTVVAHLSKDGHYYIYPDENNPRSLSVREAARIQSFPDNYYFEGGRGAAFKQIGNAVPPQLAFVIAKKMKEVLSQNSLHGPKLYPDLSRRTEPVGTD